METPDGFAPVPPLASPVVDTTGTLDVQSRRQLEQQALALQQRKGAQLQILMVPTTRPEEIEEYAVRAFEQHRLGRQKVDDGVLVVIAKDDRRARIEVGYGLEGVIPDAIAIRVINEYMTPRFRQGDYAGGLAEATRVITQLIDEEPLPPPMAQPATSGARRGGNPLLALIAAFFVAQMARGLFGGAPAFFRGIAGGIAAAAVAALLAGLLFGAIGGLIGFFLGLSGGRRVRYARDVGLGGWGGGGFGGGGFGGGGFGGGGGWGGGGGMSGGGGASGSW
ncbi:MAG TPA: TPM domain-containing protein [Lysobacter sp.]|nr:TPM domain-containing protein [Lysobacter sp.]